MSTSTGTIIGGVTVAEDGSPVPGVLIEASDQSSNAYYSGYSRENGRYDLPDVEEGGPYVVTASLTGFETAERKGQYVHAKKVLEIDFALKISTVG